MVKLEFTLYSWGHMVVPKIMGTLLGTPFNKDVFGVHIGVPIYGSYTICLKAKATKRVVISIHTTGQG